MTWHDWANLLVRWTHFIAGIAWIGSSFYFMWLDRSLEVPRPARPDVEGSLWMVHSGGFYQVERRRIGPGRMPPVLHWFKWEAAITWISGAALLVLVYYSTSGLYLTDPQIARIGAGTAAAVAAATIVAGWLIYDLLWGRTGERWPGPVLVVSLLLLAGVAGLYARLLSGRAAFLHLGALLGTIMVANVWLRILPAQQRMIDATARGEEPDLRLGERAKRRSVHNSYVTFSVLALMLSNHFPGAFGAAHRTAVLVLLVVLGIAARHVMIGVGRGRLGALGLAVAALAGMIALAPPQTLGRGARTAPVAAMPADSASFARVQAIVLARCTACHAAEPRIAAFGAAPGGVSFDDPAAIRRWAERIRVRVVETQTMPLGNMTAMTPEERRVMAAWIARGAPSR